MLVRSVLLGRAGEGADLNSILAGTAEDAALSELAETLLAMPTAEIEGWLDRQPPHVVELAERALGERLALGWRATPATMAHRLTEGRIKLYRYTSLLGEKFRDAVDGRSPRQIWNIGRRYGKPASVDSLVLMGDGSRRRLGDVEVGEEVISHSGAPRRVLAVHEQGRLPAVRIRTAHGRSTVAALDHPFLTPGGYVEASKLKPGDAMGRTWGDAVLVVEAPQTTGATVRSAAEFRLAGYFIGDGSVGHQDAAVTCFDPIEGADLRRCAADMGWEIRAVNDRGRYGFRCGPTGRAAGPRPWLVDAGLAGSTSWTKRVPPWVFSAPREMIAEFVGAYFACDGTVSGGTDGRGLEFYSVARDLLADVQHLLTRLGIESALTGKIGSYRGRPHGSYRLRVLGRDGLARFAQRVPLHSQKALRLAAFDPRRLVPDGSFMADPVVAVEDAGMVECRCLTVEDDQTFTVDDLVVHNSTIASRWGPAWCLDRHPDANLMLVSYGDDLSNENATAVRDILRDHKSALRVSLRRDRQRADRFVTDANGGLIAGGIDSALTGFGAGAGGGAVVDDPYKNWQEAHSEARRKHVWNQYRAVVRSALEDEEAWIIIVQTRWHQNDLTGQLLSEMENDTGEPWELVRLPTVAEAHNPSAHSLIDRLPDPLGRAPGELLAPERFGELHVKTLHVSLGSYLTSGLEQQRPSPEEGGEIKRAWWKLAAIVPPRFDDGLTSWDMKLKDKEAGDFVVGQAWGRTGADYWLYDQLRGQWNQATTANAIALMAVRHPETTRHVIENTGNGPEVIEALRMPMEGYVVDEEMGGLLGMTDEERRAVSALRQRGMPGLVPNTPKGDKRARARAVTPYVEAGNVHLPEHAAWLGGFLEETAAFPNGTHDDQVDSFSQALKLLAHGPASLSAPTGTLPSSRRSGAPPGPRPGPTAGPRSRLRRGVG